MKRFNQQSCSSSPPWEGGEEEASFSDDAIFGSQGGVGAMWPPRSYSCSFCKREFRSAQALGGHMNVHRRDRALLKQVMITSTYNNDDDDHHHDHQNHDHHVMMMKINNPSKSSMVSHHQNPSQVCCPKTSVAHHHLSLSRVSSNYSISEVKKVISSANDVVVQAKLSMGLDLTIGTYNKEENYQEDYYLKNKRFKKNGDFNSVKLFPLIEEIKCSNHVKANISMEELDLELRLGN